MVDRLIGVGGEFAAWEAESLVEVDCGAEGEDARCDAGEQAGGGAAAVALEQELVFEAVDDRLDPLPGPADRRGGGGGGRVGEGRGGGRGGVSGGGGSFKKKKKN